MSKESPARKSSLRIGAQNWRRSHETPLLPHGLGISSEDGYAPEYAIDAYGFAEVRLSNLADTSRAALERVDRTAGQKRVLSVFAKWTNISRHEIADKSGLPLKSVCGRVNELLKAGALVELDATRDGRHLLQLKTSVHDVAESVTTRTAFVRLPVKASCAEPSAAAQEFHPEASSPLRPASAAPISEGVKYHVPGRWSMDESVARSILNHKQIKLIPAWCVDEARKVMQEGRHWVWN